MGKVSNTNCSVFGCNSHKESDPSLHYHKYPQPNTGSVNLINRFGIAEKIDRRKAWTMKLKMGKPVGSSMLVCSKHFTLEDYFPPGPSKQIQPRLKKTAVPSLNLPKSSVITSKPDITNRVARHAKLEDLRKKNVSATVTSRGCMAMDTGEVAPSTTTVEMNAEGGILEATELCTDNSSKDVQDNLTVLNDLSESERITINTLIDSNFTNKENVFNCNKNVQVSSGDFVVSFISSIQSNKQLNSLTGIDSFEILNALTDMVKESYPDKKLSHTLEIKERIILVFMKLKLALTFVVISFLFKISPATCRSIFDDYADKLSNILKCCIPWPSTEEIRSNIPACFKNFQSVRVVLDCTEIPIQRPKCLCCRIRTYSTYKGRHTVKVMTGVSPAGLLTFLSRSYGGRSSDKAIFEQSKLIEKLIPHFDSIMVDKGFLIDKICEEHFIKLLRPPFLRRKTQFTEEEAKENVLIARARVHVERLNQRIKTFQIFNNALPWNMVKNIEHIFTIVVGMVNLQNPVLKDDKF